MYDQPGLEEEVVVFIVYWIYLPIIAYCLNAMFESNLIAALSLALPLWDWQVRFGTLSKLKNSASQMLNQLSLMAHDLKSQS